MISELEPLIDGLLLRRAKRQAGRYPWTTVEAEARRETWIAFHDRMHGRLFDPGPHEGSERRHWDAMEDQWLYKAIGCVARLDREIPERGEHDYYPYTYDEAVVVGIFLGVNLSYFGGYDFVLGHFSGPGTSVHRSPLNVGFVHILGEPYQQIVDINYRDDEEEGWC